MGISRLSEDDKRTEIVERLDVNKMIEAGAGGGKTTLIVKNIINQIQSGNVLPENLVVITFTKKAAEEVRGRIMAKIQEARKMAPEGSEERIKLDYACKNLNRIQISTIHSFCYALLTEHALRVKLPLGMEMLENEAAENREREFIRVWMRKLSYEDVKYLNDEFFWTGVKEALTSTFLSICELPSETEFCYEKELLESTDTASLCKEAEAILTRIKTAIEAVILEEKKLSYDISDATKNDELSYVKKPCKDIFMSGRIEINKDNFRDYIDNIKYFIDNQNPFKAVKDVFPKTVVESAGVSFAAKIDQNELEEFVAKVRAYQNAVIVDYALMARDKYMKFLNKKEQLKYLTNDKLLEKAYYLAKDSEEARRVIKEKVACIYLDEDQDTDVIQTEMIKLLCEAEEDHSRFRESMLILVGDPKQSIYKFRGADLTLYKKTKSLISGEGIEEKDKDKEYYKNSEFYTLDMNYRSNPKVVEWVNSEFKDRFTEMFGGYSPMDSIPRVIGATDREDAVCDMASDSLTLEGVYRFQTSSLIVNDPAAAANDDADEKSKKKKTAKSGGKDKAKSVKIEDPIAVATVIKNLVENDKCLIFDKVSGNPKDGFYRRRLKYSDFMVLTEVTSKFSDYMGAFRKMNIPVTVDGKFHIDKEIIVKRVRALYAFTASPKDKRRETGCAVAIMNGLVKKNIDDRECQLKMKALIKETENMSAVAVLYYIVHHYEWFIDGEKDAVSIRWIEAMLEQLYESIISKGNLERNEVLEELDAYIAGDIHHELSLSSDVDAVRLMNVHQSKGLESKIVIIAARDHETKVDDEGPYRVGLKYYPAVKYVYHNNANYIAAYGLKKDVREAAVKAERDEHARLNYVAATRAMEALIFMDVTPDSKGNVNEKKWFVDYQLETNVEGIDENSGRKVRDIVNEVPGLRAAFAGALKQEVDSAAAEETKDTAGDKDGEKAENKAALEKSVIEYSPEIWKTELSDSQFEKTYGAVSPSGLEGGGAEWKPGEEDRPVGDIFGTIMHRCFELLVNRIRVKGTADGISDKYIKKVINAAILESYDKMTERGSMKEGTMDALNEFIARLQAYLPEKLESFVNNKVLVGRILDAEEVHTELAFSMYVDRAEVCEFNQGLLKVMDERTADDTRENTLNKFWINGQADLVLVNQDGTINIIDYKSDKIGTKSMAEYIEHLTGTYDNQQLLYEFVMSKLFNVDKEKVSHEYYHLYLQN